MSLAGLLDADDLTTAPGPDPGATDGDLDEVIVSAGDDHRRRGELRDQAEALAVELRRLGVEPGHAVAVSLPSGPDVVAALFGVWRAGAVYVPLNPRLSPTERERVLAQVRPAAVLTPAASATPRDGASAYAVTGHLDAQDAEPARHDADVALIQFTSGTTGPPKAVPLRHSSVLELLDGVVSSLRGSGSGSGSRGSSGPTDRAPMPNVIPVSLSLWAGLYNVLFALRVGAPIVILDPFTPASFERVVKQYGIRSTVLPPAAMTMLADDPAVADLEPLRYVRSITAPLSPLQARRFRDKFGVSVLNCYGQTEIGGEIVGWNAADSRAWGESKLGSVGRPHAGVEIRAVDPSGTPLPVDEAGELCVRTPALDPGAPGREDLADRLTPDGWFRTGDIGRIDPEGFVWIEGRVSDMINRGGLKVFPEEVAEVLRLAPDVEDAAVVGQPDTRLGEVPVAFVVLAPGTTGLDPDALDELCRSHLAPYKVPVRFLAIDELPRNEIGKVRAGELVDRAEAAR